MSDSDSESTTTIPDPVLQDGIEYWKTQPASLDGVLGGYGTGSLPRIDSLGSRLFTLLLLPELSTVPSAIRPLAAPASSSIRTRALDVGAGIGRVTADVLLHLVSDVVLLEPVEPFVQEALSRGRASLTTGTGGVPWKGIADKSKSVTLLQGPLQTFDPLNPIQPQNTKFLDRVGYQPSTDDMTSGFDLVWCQWCLGHLSDIELAAFLRLAKKSLRNKDRSLIVVKENLCSDGSDGSARIVFDESDSSLTRSDMAWKAVFEKAGLVLVKESVQEGLPEGLYVVKMYALR